MMSELNRADREYNRILHETGLKMCRVLNNLSTADQDALTKRAPKIIRLRLGVFTNSTTNKGG